MTVREYHVAVCNEGARETFELVFDIYPQQAPAHPERHYGHWNKRIELDAGEQRDIVVRWDAARKAVAIDGEPADSSWHGPLDEAGRYDVSFLLYRQGQVDRADLYETDILQLLRIDPVTDEKLLTQLESHVSETDLKALAEVLCDLRKRMGNSDRFRESGRSAQS